MEPPPQLTRSDTMSVTALEYEEEPGKATTKKRFPAKKYPRRTLPLIIEVISAAFGTYPSGKSTYVIKVEYVNATTYKVLMTGHAPWTVVTCSDDVSLRITSLSIGGTILSLVNEAAALSETWNDLKLKFRFGQSGCSLGNICWPDLSDIHVSTVTEHLEFVIGTMKYMYGV